MTLNLPLRVRLGILLILAFAAASDVRWLRTAVAARHWTYGQDEISQSDERLRALQAALPPHTVLGYVTSPPPVARCSSDSAFYQTVDYHRSVFKRYVLTQYALAPAIVAYSAQYDSVVGNFTPGDSIDMQLPPGMRPLRDFGDGVVLLSRDAH